MMAGSADFDTRAFNAVKASAEWIAERVRTGDYTDEYIAQITADNPERTGAMPVAECLMSLLNIAEREYQELGIFQIENDLLLNGIEDLINAVDESAFSGWPYLQIDAPDEDVAFTDCVNYVLGAIVRVFRTDGLPGALSEAQRNRLLEIGKSCLDWLLENQVVFDIEDQERGTITVGGWRWSDIETAADDNIQIFFTTQSTTSLLEVFFEAPELAAKREDQVLESIVHAKNYICYSIIEPDSPHNVGWVNIHCAMQPGKTDNIENSNGDNYVSLYPLECLSYIRLYGLGESYRSIHRKFRRKNQKLWSSFMALDTVIESGIENFKDRFISKIKLKGDNIESDDKQNKADKETTKKIIMKNAALDFNLPDYANSHQNNKYVDGTVIFNIINSLQFSFKQFGFSEEGNYSGNREPTLLRWASGVIEYLFSENCFQHIEELNGDDKKVHLNSIYATRTAISTLLSLGIERPEVTEQTIPAGELRDLVKRLASLLNIERAPEAMASEAPRLNKERVHLLLLAGVSIGLLVGELGNDDDFNRPAKSAKENGSRLRRSPEMMSAYIAENVIETNVNKPIGIIEGLYERDIGSVIQDSEFLAESPFSFEALRSWIANNVPDSKDGSHLKYKKGIDLRVPAKLDLPEVDKLLHDLIQNIENGADNEGESGMHKKLFAMKTQLIG